MLGKRVRMAVVIASHASLCPFVRVSWKAQHHPCWLFEPLFSPSLVFQDQFFQDFSPAGTAEWISAPSSSLLLVWLNGASAVIDAPSPSGFGVSYPGQEGEVCVGWWQIWATLQCTFMLWVAN